MGRESAIRRIEENRRELEGLANSDTPAAFVAEELLAAADNDGD